MDQVEQVGGIMRQSWTGRTAVMPVIAIDPEQMASFMPNLSLQGSRMGTGQVLMGEGLATNEGLGQGAVLQNGQYHYEVAGLVSSSTGSFQDYFVYMPLTTAIKETNAQGVQEVWVKLRDPYSAPEVAARINELKIPGAHALTKQQYMGISADYIKYVWMLQFCIAAIGVLIAMTAAMNTMLMSTYERLREFATLRAIGASRMLVVMMIMGESVLLSLAGGIAGIFFGWLASYLLDRAVLVLFKLTFPLAKVTPVLVGEALLLSCFVGMVGAALPAIIVWRLKIVDGLRWD